MTGYGKSVLEDARFTQSWEIRGVNSRYLDVKWRLPLFLRAFEPELEKVLRGYVLRGRVECHLSLRAHASAPNIVNLNTGLLETMIRQLDDFAQEKGLDFNPDLGKMLAVDAIWTEDSVNIDPEMSKQLAKGLSLALTDFVEDRAREGATLAKDIKARVENLKKICKEIETAAPLVLQEKIHALTTRLGSIMESAGFELSADRTLQETAILVDRLDVTEELTRLDSHLTHLINLLSQDGELGKRLDFLMQEILREINTCGNKMQDIKTSRLVVEFKAEVEKCREQVQNLE